MPEYKLIVNKGRAVIMDEQGQPINPRVGQPVVKALQETYPRAALVYILHCPSRDIYKIGMTSQPISSRISQVKRDENVNDIVLIHTIECDTVDRAADIEFMFHTVLYEARVKGEWFDLHDDEISDIKKHNDWLQMLRALLGVWDQTRSENSDFGKGPREEAVYKRSRSEAEVYTRLYRERQDRLDVMSAEVKELGALYRNLEDQLDALRDHINQKVTEDRALAKTSLHELRHRHDTTRQSK